jgi:hypothetical protein
LFDADGEVVFFFDQASANRGSDLRNAHEFLDAMFFPTLATVHPICYAYFVVGVSLFLHGTFLAQILPHSSFTVRDGLPSNTITAIFQDYPRLHLDRHEQRAECV